LLFTSVAAAIGLTLAPNLIQQAQAVDLVTVGLHNTTAGVAECPEDVTGDAWHFVAPPKSSTDFVHITLVLHNSVTDVDDTVVIPDETWISEPLQGDAYVLVPAGYSIDSLVGGTFVITGSDKEVRLSHTCGGGGGEETPPDVTVTKTANVTFDEDFDWTIDKRIVSIVPHTTSADVNYAIDVTKSAAIKVPGSYVVTGVITVKNDSADTSVADIVGLDDALTTTAATCTLDVPFSEVVLAAGRVAGLRLHVQRDRRLADGVGHEHRNGDRSVRFADLPREWKRERRLRHRHSRPNDRRHGDADRPRPRHHAVVLGLGHAVRHQVGSDRRRHQLRSRVHQHGDGHRGRLEGQRQRLRDGQGLHHRQWAHNRVLVRQPAGERSDACDIPDA